GGFSCCILLIIAKLVVMCKTNEQQILKQNDLKPPKVAYWCGKSTDPEFEEKMLNVIGLYMNEDQKAMGPIRRQENPDTSQPELPLKSGLPKRHTTTYKRNGTVALMAALAVHQGEITAEAIGKSHHENFLKFLKKLYRKYPKKHLHIIADNLNVPKHHKVREWVDAKKRLTLHFTPTYSSWLNQIEIWFNILSKMSLKGAFGIPNNNLSNNLCNM
ncbi:MAG: IS630 family transposase, partial [Bacteroidota bacterium]